MTKTQKSREEFAEIYYSETNKLSDNDLWKFCRSKEPADIFEKVLQKALSQHTEDIIKKLEKMSYQEDNLYGDLPGNEVVNLDQAIEAIK